MTSDHPTPSAPTTSRAGSAARAAAPVALILAALILTAVNLRTAVTGFSPLLATIGDDLGFGEAVFGLFGTIVTASFSVFGLLAPLFSRRVGLEVAILVATALTTLGILLRAFAPTPTLLILSTVVAFAGIGTSNVLIVPLVKKYFAARLKGVTSLYLALLQLGQFTAPLIAVPVALTLGWRFAIGMWAAVTAVAVVLWLVVALRVRATDAAAGRSDGPGVTPPHGASAASGATASGPAASGAAPAAAAHEPRIVGAWKTPLLWSLVLMFGMTALHTYTVITWLPTILVDAGAPAALGGALLALFSVFGLGAAFVIPPLTLRLRNPSVIAVVCVALLAIGYTGLMIAPLEGAIVWVIALGLGVSTFPMCLTLINARTRTARGSSTLSGAAQGLGYAIACLGPLLIGVLYSASGTWTSSYLLLYISLGVLLVSSIVASRPQFLEAEVPSSPPTP